jgi:DNA-binding response OmpR family regulator
MAPGKSRTVDVHVQRLRRKMGGELFETVHGKGYKLRAVPMPF